MFSAESVIRINPGRET